jgi:signal transduction histidine kinase/DNA-binding response OmpR family regulator
MKNLPITKNYFLWFLLVCICKTFGQGDPQIATAVELKTTLSEARHQELKELQEQIALATNTLDSAKIYNRLSIIYLTSKYYISKPKYDSVRYYAAEAMKLTEQAASNEHLQQHLLSLGLIGNVQRDLGNTSEAINYFNTILNITDTVNDPNFFYKNRQSATTHIASFYAYQKKYNLAIERYDDLFHYVEKNTIDTTQISSIVYLRYARFHRIINKLAIASKYAAYAVKVARRNKLLFRVAMVHLEWAHIKLKTDQIQEMTMHLETAYKLLKDKVEYKGLLSEYYHIKSIIAKRSSNNVERVYNAEKAFGLLNEKTVSEKHIELGTFLYETYKDNGDFKKANDILEQIFTLEKKLYNPEEIKKSAFSEIRRKEKSVALAEAEGEKMNSIITFIVFLLVICSGSAFYIYFDRKKKILLAREIAAQNKQLEQLDKAKSQFFSNITHELQTPLTLITGPLELALQENNLSLDTATKSKLQMAMHNTASLKTLVDDILDLSKLKAKKLSLRTQSTDLDTFLNETMRRFIPLMKQKKIVFNFCFKELQGVHAIIDTKKLEKVLNNLLSNAIKYTLANGTITVSGKLSSKEKLAITIEDTGIGISKEDLPFVFDRYFQSKDTSKPLEGGYGIGLSLVKELMELMHGTITAESILGKGSTFQITLPVEKIEQKKYGSINNKTFPNFEALSNHFVQNVQASKHKNTVLIVEDHQGMQHFIASILQEYYQIHIVNNGKEALETLQNNSIDLIISDIMMPAMDGFTLLETLKQSDAYHDIPIIMLTALSEIKYKTKALTIGVDDYLTKPFVASELLARTQNLIERYNSRKELKEEDTTAFDTEEILYTNDDVEGNQITIPSTEATVTKSDTELIAKVAEIIEENMMNPDFKLHELSEKVYLSERQLRRKIKCITGLSPKKFQQEILLMKARTLLEESEYSNVKAVALSVGMNNTTRFSKLYESRFGKHPNSYF